MRLFFFFAILALPSLAYCKDEIFCGRPLIDLADTRISARFAKYGERSSSLYIGGDHQNYEAWVEEQTHSAVRSFRQNASPENILNRIRLSWRAFRGGGDFGLRREISDKPSFSLLGASSLTDRQRVSQKLLALGKSPDEIKNFFDHPVRQAVVQKLLHLGFPLAGKDPVTGHAAEIRGLTFIPSSGAPFNTSWIYHLREGPQKGFIRILHTHPARSEMMMKEIFSNVQKLLQARPVSEQRQVYRHATLSFFQAMPHRRGSSAIGRVFFRALGRQVFHFNIPLPEGIDLFAISLPFDQIP